MWFESVSDVHESKYYMWLYVHERQMHEHMFKVELILTVKLLISDW